MNNKNFNEEELNYINGKSVPYEEKSANVWIQRHSLVGPPFYDVYAKVLANEKYVFEFSTIVAADELYRSICLASSNKFDVERDGSTVTTFSLVDNDHLIIPLQSWQDAKHYAKSLREQEITHSHNREQSQQDTLKL